MDSREANISIIPEDAKNISACSRCHYVMENRQWRSVDVCPNCSMERDTLRFQGAVALMTVDGEESYVYRLLRSKFNADPRIPGVYAVTLMRRATIEDDD